MKCCVVPYRDRAAQLHTLLPVLRRHFDRVVIVEQAQGLPFNRGAIKDCGVAHCGLQPSDTLCFHDVDLLPGPRFRGYPTAQPDAVHHLYGHRHCLGGIIAMQLQTYRALGGFQRDKWSWGGEDTDLQRRALARGLTIVRAPFTLRYQDDASVTELDAAGRPMRGAAARELFLAEFARRRAAPEDEFVRHGALRFREHGDQHDPDGGIVHAVYE